MEHYNQSGNNSIKTRRNHYFFLLTAILWMMNIQSISIHPEKRNAKPITQYETWNREGMIKKKNLLIFAVSKILDSGRSLMAHLYNSVWETSFFPSNVRPFNCFNCVIPWNNSQLFWATVCGGLKSSLDDFTSLESIFKHWNFENKTLNRETRGTTG